LDVDVILDTNIFYSLLLAHGAEFITSSRFADLMTYLRRTASNLVIPAVVLEEFSRKYSDLVADSYKKSRDTWESLNRSLVKPLPYLVTVDPPLEFEKIKLELLNPGKGVHVTVFDNYACVPVEDVVMRGIHRIRPASPKGEELRDVVIWFMVLEYAKAKEIAFISDDGTFASENNLHPDLEKDLTDRNVRVNFFTSIPQFIKAKALTAKEITDTELVSFVQSPEMQEMIRDYVVGRILRGSKKITKAEIGAAQLMMGSKYEIAADSIYIEAKFSAESHVELQENPWTFLGQAFPAEQAKYGGFAFGQPGETTLFQPGFVDPSLWNQTTLKYQLPSTQPATTSETVIFVAEFTLRIVGGKRESLEIESVSI
jgi:PIN domain-containing protein